MSAFSCLPRRGSEPGVGWNWAIQASRNDDLEIYVLTRTKCKDKIEAEKRNLNIPNLHFLYCNSSAKLREKSIYLEYIHWQWKSYFFLKKKMKEIEPDLIWFLTFGNAFLPIFVHLLKVPFVWGPIGGGEHVNQKFYRNMPFKQKAAHYLKLALIKTAKMNPIVLSPAKHAKRIVVRTRETAVLFPRRYQNKIIQCLETCIDIEEVRKSARKFCVQLPQDKIKICYTGRLTSMKNVRMLVNAVIRINKVENVCNLYLLGNGEEFYDIMELVKTNKMQENIFLLGERNREESLAYVKHSDIFAFPSLREAGTWSLMEAMALGKACICMDGSGMKEIANGNAAIKIPITSPEESENDFERKLGIFIKDKDLRRKLGENASMMIEERYNWDKIRQFIESLCEEIVLQN